MEPINEITNEQKDKAHLCNKWYPQFQIPNSCPGKSLLCKNGHAIHCLRETKCAENRQKTSFMHYSRACSKASLGWHPNANASYSVRSRIRKLFHLYCINKLQDQSIYFLLHNITLLQQYDEKICNVYGGFQL